jgi:dTDP-4-dehydrorhamnose 3,5-epimerase
MENGTDTSAPAPPGATAAAQQDRPLVDASWRATGRLIDGVVLHEVRSVVTRNGITTEVLRKDWGVTGAEIVHAIHVHFRAGALSAWHMHRRKTDHLFVVAGLLRAVLYDDRDGSPTRGLVNELHLSPARPQLVVIPAGVFHGLQALGSEPAAFVNYFDDAYSYDEPDDHRLPPDTDAIPYRFA